MLRSIRDARLVAVAAVALLAACGGSSEEATEAETATAANPCAANPCAAADDMVDAALVTQGDRVLDTHGKSEAELAALGEALWNDGSLSTTGVSCASCHVDKYAMMQATFADPYPHFVKMAQDRAGMDQVTAAEMVQLCMVIPMQSDPLAWESEELAALASYVADIQPGFDPSMAGGMNPCSANPCAAE